jgi:hypothetical protein
VHVRTKLAAGFALVALLAAGCGGYGSPGRDQTTSTPSSGTTTTSGGDGY